MAVSMALRSESGCGSSNVGVLSEEQRQKLHSILTADYEIQGRELPTLSVRALDFTVALRNKMLAHNIPLAGVRLNGSAASYVVSNDGSENLFNDLDILFMLAEQPAGTSVHELFEAIRVVFFECLLELLPQPTQGISAREAFFLQGYIQKMFKVPSRHGLDTGGSDVWSLITLNSDTDRNLEYKFVLKLRREFEFSIDSVQITLDLEQGESQLLAGPVAFTALHGPIEEVLGHLNNREIAINNPELVRGGGLLKYCYLRAQGYTPVCAGADLTKLELYMCNRFLIDYSTGAAISMTLYNYFFIRLCKKEALRRLALIHLRDLVVRYQFGERLDFIGIIEAMLQSLPPALPPLSKMPLLSSPRTRPRCDSPASSASLDSHTSVPTDGSSSGCDTPAPRPAWGERPFAAVAALPPRAKGSPPLLRSSPPTRTKPAVAATQPARGSSAPSSPTNKAARHKARTLPHSRIKDRAAYLEDQFPALSLDRAPRS